MIILKDISKQFGSKKVLEMGKASPGTARDAVNGAIVTECDLYAIHWIITKYEEIDDSRQKKQV